MNHLDLHQERMDRFRHAGLYLVTSQSLSEGRSTEAIVEAALEAGVRLIQLREKDWTARRLMESALQVRTMTEQAGALLIINDRLDIALAVGADGVHLGQDDLPLPMARRLAPNLILGASTHNKEEVLRAQEEGASYLNIGPIFPTQTKHVGDACLGLEGLAELAPLVQIPFTVMGGIKQDHLPALHQVGARIFALVTAVTAAPDPSRATWDLMTCIQGL